MQVCDHASLSQPGLVRMRVPYTLSSFVVVHVVEGEQRICFSTLHPLFTDHLHCYGDLDMAF